VGKGATTNRAGKQVSRTGKAEARMLLAKLRERSSGWEVLPPHTSPQTQQSPQ